jgi:hypothetical protein
LRNDFNKLIKINFNNDALLLTAVPDCFLDKIKYNEMTGRSLQWFILEIMVFASYTFTMVLLMIKSRFINVGIDQSSQFEPFMMSKMANHIILNADFDVF